MKLHYDIPPHGHVRMLGFLGSDQTIVRAARTSYQNDTTRTEEQDQKLLEYLFKNRHTSPFEQCSISYEIKMPIFVMRQFVRHRTFRLNEWSGRYSELRDEFFIPKVWRRQLPKGQNKQGSEEDPYPEWNHENCDITKHAYDVAYQAYMDLLKRGVAKELARIVLPVGIYTQIHVNVDLHNLMHFLNLRLDPHAQKEIQDVAMAMVDIAEQLFPWTIRLFDKYRLRMVEAGIVRVSREKGDREYNGCSPEAD